MMNRVLTVLLIFTILVCGLQSYKLYQNRHQITALTEELSSLSAIVSSQKEELRKTGIETERLQEKLIEIQSSLQRSDQKSTESSAAQAPPPAARDLPGAESPSLSPPPETVDAGRMEARVNAIKKFIPLDESQMERLRKKFSTETGGAPSDAESLEDIIGESNAKFYREQRKEAFERTFRENVEKEALYMARQLALSPDQENALIAAYHAVEEKIRSMRLQTKNETMLQRLIREEKLRTELLPLEIKPLLKAEEYEAFIQQQSRKQDMQLWHE